MTGLPGFVYGVLTMAHLARAPSIQLSLPTSLTASEPMSQHSNQYSHTGKINNNNNHNINSSNLTTMILLAV